MGLFCPRGCSSKWQEVDCVIGGWVDVSLIISIVEFFWILFNAIKKEKEKCALVI